MGALLGDLAAWALLSVCLIPIVALILWLAIASVDDSGFKDNPLK